MLESQLLARCDSRKMYYSAPRAATEDGIRTIIMIQRRSSRK